MPGFNITSANSGTGSGPSATTESTRSHRWKFTFLGIGSLDQVVMYALSCQRPTIEIDNIPFHYKQTVAYLPGKHKWNPISVKFYEMLDGVNTASKIFTYWANGVISIDTNTINPKFAGRASISTLDGAGSEQYYYTLYNVWPGKIEPSELDYSNSTLATIQVTLNYDAVEESSNMAVTQLPNYGNPIV